MTVALSSINDALRAAGPHRTRPIRLLRPETVSGWRLKLYTIAPHGQTARPGFVDETVRRIPEIFGPWPAADPADPRHGIGFIIAHDATATCIALYYWWQSFNELHQHILVGPKDDPRAMTRFGGQAAGCVWELEVVDFERRAWLGDMLANPAGPDVERYLARRIDTDL